MSSQHLIGVQKSLAGPIRLLGWSDIHPVSRGELL